MSELSLTNAGARPPHRVLWVGGTTRGGLREVAMLRDCGKQIVHWGGIGDVSTESCSTLASDDVDYMSRVNFARIGSESLAFICKHFSTVVVEQSVAIWSEYIRAFPGRLLFRTYGLLSRASDQLWDFGVTQLMIQRRNLKFIPAMPVAAVEEPWVSGLTAEVVGSHVISEDTHGIIWRGPFRQRTAATIIIPNIGSTDYDRRHKNFIKEFCSSGPSCCNIVEFNELDGSSPWEAILDTVQLSELAQSSALFYTEQSSTFLYGYVLQAIIMGLPVIYLTNSLIARLIGSGAGQAVNLSEARYKLAKLVDGDSFFVNSVLSGQQALSDRLTSAAIRREFTNRFPTMLPSRSDQPEGAALHCLTKDGNVTLWLQLERLLASLINPGDVSTVSEKNTNELEPERRILESLFHIALQRDPNKDEIHRLSAKLTHGTTALNIMGLLLKSREGQALWPRNRMQAWLSGAPLQNNF